MNEDVTSNPVSTKPKTWLKLFIPIFAILLVIIALENLYGNFSTDIKASNSLPADGWLVWASKRQEGRFEIYLAKADGSGIIRLTQNGAKHPTWSPDGAWISYEAADGSVHVMRPDKSKDKKLLDSGSAPFWMHDGSGLFVVEGSSYSLLDPETGSKKALFKKSDFAKVADKELQPSGITADGKFLVALSDRYRNGYTGDNGYFNAVWAAIILDLGHKDKVYFFGNGCEPTTPPAGSRIYHVFSGAGQAQCPSGLCPDIMRMDLAPDFNRSSYAAEMAHADSDWGHEYFPRVSTDGKWLSYGASTGCHDHDSCDYEIFIHRLGADNSDRQRVTNNINSDQWPHLFIGELWKPLSTGGSNIFLGYNAGYYETGLNKLYIDSSNTSAPLIYGDFGTDKVGINGWLGVGTQAPAYPMELKTTGSNAAFVANRSGGAINYINATDTFGNFGTVNNFPLRLTVNAVWKLRLNADNSLLMANGATCTAGGVWTNASSLALKENVTTLTGEEAATTLQSLHPVKYNYKAEKDKTYIGFIAEQVPKLVAMTDRKALSPMDIVAVLTQVVKDQQELTHKQQQTIENMTQKIRERKKIIADLLERVARIEKKK